MTAEEELALDIARSLVHDHSYLYVLEEAYNNDLDWWQVWTAWEKCTKESTQQAIRVLWIW